MEAGLFPFIFDIYLPGALVVEEHLPEDEFEVIFVHIIARARHLIIAHVREVEGCAVAMTALRDRIDIAATLEVPDVFLRTQHGCHIKTVMGQVIAAQYIRPLRSDSIEFAFGGRDEVGHGMGQIIDDIVFAGLDLDEAAVHRSGIGSVLGWSRQTDSDRSFMLLGLQVVELDPVVEGAPRVLDEVALLNRKRFGLLMAGKGKERQAQI